MKRLGFLILALTLLIPATGIVGARSLPQSGIIIRYAHGTWGRSLTPSAGLEQVAGAVAPRTIVQYAKALAGLKMVNIPPDLKGLVDPVHPRVSVQYANALYGRRLTIVPTGLRDLAEQVAPRVVLNDATADRPWSLLYPKLLFNDATPPVISNVQAAWTGVVTWKTDEFANSAVRYGLQPGQYSQTAADPLYEKAHVVRLKGLIPGQVYYLSVRSVDRSGNQADSTEYQFQALYPAYLPLMYGPY